MAHGTAGVEKEKDRLSGGGKIRRVRTAITAAHFHVSRILETWKFPGLRISP